MKSHFSLYLFIALSSLSSSTLHPTTSPQTQSHTQEAVDLNNFQLDEPTAIINGCVNAITGSYVEASTDLIAPCAEPIYIQRSYSSNNAIKFKKAGSLCHTWYLNHGGDINLTKTSDGTPNGLKTVAVCKEGGNECVYEQKKNNPHYIIVKEMLQNGTTNCSNGEISGQTNIKNQYLLRDKPNKNVTLKTGSGAEQIYKECAIGKRYQLEKEIKPNGNALTYEYNTENKLTRVNSYNSKGLLLSSAKLKYHSSKKNPSLEIKTSDQSTALYQFCVRKDDRFFLESMTKSNGYFEKYQYEKGEEDYVDRLIRKEYPGQNYLELDYYKRGKNFVGDTVVKCIADKRIHRVKQLKAPVGTDATPIVTHKFFYDIEEDRNFKIKKGKTSVYNAYNHRTDYSYNAENRLKAITKYLSDKVYTIEKFYWGEEKTENESNLISRTLENSKGQIIFCVYYQYDSKGNVLTEELFGNLTGKNKSPVFVDKKGIPQKNGCEYVQKRYTYSQDNFNLMLTKEEGNQIQQFGYYPNSNLLKYKFILSKEQKIQQRTFYVYDDNGVLSKEIIDDGSQRDQNNLSGVSERHINYIQSTKTTPIGLPSISEEYYLDLSSGKEISIGKIVNQYNSKANLTRQDHYNNEGLLSFSLLWEYDAKGNVTKEINACGHTINRTYDQSNNLVSECGPHPQYQKKYVYDQMNRLIKEEIIDAGQTKIVLSSSYAYNYLSQKTSCIDPCGNTTTFQYDDLGRLIKTVLPSTQNELGDLKESYESLSYDELNNVVAKTDSRGYTTKYFYNIRGQVTSCEYPDGSIEKNEYSLEGLLIRSIAKNGTITTYQYDYQNRLQIKSLLSPFGEILKTYSYKYNTFHLLSETDPEGIETKYQYDFAGQLKSVTKENQKTVFEYDALNRPCKKKNFFGPGDNDFIAEVKVFNNISQVVEERFEDHQGHIEKQTYYTYDENGKQTSEKKLTSSGLTITEKKYNALGILCKIIDAKKNETKILNHYGIKNAFGQGVHCEETVDPLGNSTCLTKDAKGQLVSLQKKNKNGLILAQSNNYYDLVGNRTFVKQTVFSESGSKISEQWIHWQYDNLNRMTSLVEGYGTSKAKVTLFSYNKMGQIEKIVKPNKVELNHTYDHIGRLTSLKSSDKSVHYEYCYDKNDQVTTAKDLVNLCKTEKKYNKLNNLISETLGNDFILDYKYDSTSRPIQMSFSDGSFVNYIYEGHLLKTIEKYNSKNELQYAHNYTQYDPQGKLLESSLIHGLGNIAFSYDQNEFIQKIESPFWKECIPENGYDALGNLLELKVNDKFTEVNCHYSYTDLFQLKNEKGFSEHTYNHDSLFNRLKQDQQKYELNELNQVINTPENEFKYDANGNLVELLELKTSTTTKYSYDALDRLTTVEKPNQKIVYQYDESNRRLLKKRNDLIEGEWKQSDVTNYYYQGQNEIGSKNISIEKDTLFDELRILGLGKGAEIGAAISLELDGKTYAPIHDHNGNVVTLIDVHTQKSVETYRYTAFGEETILDEEGSAKELSINPWRFSSKRKDKETGLINFGRRYYQTHLGRWLTADPLGYEAGPNLYAYVSNNPLTHFDLYGLLDQERRENLPRANLVDKTGKAISSLARLPGRTIEYLGRNWIPIPIVSDGVEIIGHFLAGRDMNNYVPNLKRKSFIGCIGNGEEIDGQRQNHVNGIGVSYSEMLTRMQNLSQENKGKNVHFVYNASHGCIYDIIGCVLLRLGYETPVCEVARDAHVLLAQELEGVDGGGELWGSYHSQGALILHRIQDSLGGIKNIMNVWTMGSPVAINGKKFNKAINFVSGFDFVSYLFDSLNCVKGELKMRDDMILMPARSTPWGDHFYDGMNYSLVIGSFIDYYNEVK